MKQELILSKNLEDIAIIGSWVYQKGTKTQTYYKRVVRDFFNFYPSLTLKTVQITHLALFLKAYGEHSPTTRNTYKNALSSLFSFAAKTGYIERNPALALDNIKTPDNIYSKVLSREQVKRMIDMASTDRDKVILKILYYTGLRVDEISKLKTTSFQRTEWGTVMLVEGKGRKVRSVHIPDHFMAELADYIVQLPSPLLFTNQKNTFGVYKPLNTSQIYRIVKAAAKKAGLNVQPSPHWLRHTCATHAIESGAPIHVVQRSLGHESISTTGKYLEIRPKESVSDFIKPLK